MATVNIYDMADTWNDGLTTFTAIKMDVTNTASASGSLLMDLQVGGTSKFKVDKSGDIITAGSLFATTGLSLDFQLSGLPVVGVGLPYLGLIKNASIRWTNSTIDPTATGELFLTRKAAANLRLGAADAAGPVAQTLSVQSVVAGTTNTAGQNFTIQGSAGTGSGAGGSIIFQVAPAGTSGTGQNTLVDALTIEGDTKARFASAIYIGGTSSPVELRKRASNTLSLYLGSTAFYEFKTSSGFTLHPSTYVGWGSGDATDTADTTLYRDAANTLALRNGANAQTFNIYNTFTDASNYERGFMKWNSNVLEIGAEAAGSGTAKPIKIVGATYLEAVPSHVIFQNAFNESLKLHASYGLAWCAGSATDGASITSRLMQTVHSGTGYGVDLSVGAFISAPLMEIADAKTFAGLPTTPRAGQIARITDGDSGLTHGQTAVNSGAGATPYLVWYNGTNWTVIGV